MEANDTDDEILLLAVATAIVNQRNKKKRDRRRRWYVHPRNIQRFKRRYYFQHIEKIGAIDPNLYVKEFRMTKALFDKLLSLLSNKLIHGANHRSPILPAERLAITLKCDFYYYFDLQH